FVMVAVAIVYALLSACRTAAIKARTLAGSFLPGLASTPEATSTPQGFSICIASVTLVGFSPPATTTLEILLMAATKGTASCQSKVSPVPPGRPGVLESRKIALTVCRGLPGLNHPSPVNLPSLLKKYLAGKTAYFFTRQEGNGICCPCCF